MSELIPINSEKLSELIQEVESAYFPIPFGNTEFQREAFVVAAQITPQRAYRSIGLQLHAILIGLKAKQHELAKRQIDIDEIKEKLEDSTLNKFERRRLELKLTELTANDNWEKKLLNDTLQELEFYYNKFSSFPRYTREQFEAGERLYFEQSLQRQMLGLTGAKESLMNMIDDVKTIENFENAVKALTREELEQAILAISDNSLAGRISLQPNME
jgi:hypothetical protein